MMEGVFSVVVLTYNQSHIVTETLDSIYNQTFRNIELIISDDASKDSTQEIVKHWVEKHKDRFVNILTNFNDENLGIVKNHNLALRLASGEFIKSIAGDDILLPDALEKMHSFLVDNNQARFCASKMRAFYTKDGERIFFDEFPQRKILNKMMNASADEQFRIICQEDFVPAPGTFFRKSVFDDYGYTSEMFKVIEDWPQWLNFLLNGERLYFLNEVTVLYRVHKNSVSTSALRNGNTTFYSDTLNIYRHYILPNVDKLSLAEAISVTIRAKVYANLLEGGINQKNYRKVRYYKLADPLWWINVPNYVTAKIRYVFRDRKIQREIFGE